MPQKHKHCELIHAWADGAEIEFRLYESDPWTTREQPLWYAEGYYRIKPDPLKIAIAALEKIANTTHASAAIAATALKQIEELK